MPDLCDEEYATVLVLDLPGGGSPPRLLRASYGAPDPADGLDCHADMQMRQ